MIATTRGSHLLRAVGCACSTKPCAWRRSHGPSSRVERSSTGGTAITTMIAPRNGTEVNAPRTLTSREIAGPAGHGAQSPRPLQRARPSAHAQSPRGEEAVESTQSTTTTYCGAKDRRDEHGDDENVAQGEGTTWAGALSRLGARIRRRGPATEEAKERLAGRSALVAVRAATGASVRRRPEPVGQRGPPRARRSLSQGLHHGVRQLFGRLER